MDRETLNKLSTETLGELWRVVCDESETTEELLNLIYEGDEQFLRNDFIDDILSFNKKFNKEELNDVKLKPRFEEPGDEVPLPPQEPKQPKRYIDSDDYWFGTKFHKKRMEQIKEDNELIRLRLQNERLKKEVEELKKRNKELLMKGINDNEITKKIETKRKNKELLKDLPNHFKSLKKFNKERPPTDEELNLFDNDYSLYNLERMRSYKDFVNFQNQREEQDELIKKIINKIKKNTTNWYIDFRKLNDYGKDKIINPLIDILQNDVATSIKANTKYRFSYLINSNDSLQNGSWRSVPLRDTTFTQLIDGLRQGLLLNTLEECGAMPQFSGVGYEAEILWYYFDAVQFKEVVKPENKYKENKKGNKRPTYYNKRQGKFFPYWNVSNLDLSRYQILKRNDDYFLNRKLERIPCVAFALSQLIPHEEIAKITCRMKHETKRGYFDWRTNTYNSEHLDFFCKELKIYCRVHYFDEYSIKPQFRIFERGVNKNESKYQIELAVYKEHYFIYEKTKYTSYFIQHYNELKDLKDAYKIIGKRKSGTYQRDSREKYCLNSLDLLI